MGNMPERHVKKKNGHMNLSWLKHQYYSLGRSIQDIADKLDVSMMSVRKWLDRIEEISANKEVKGQLKENTTSKPVKDFSKIEIRDWQPLVVSGNKKEKLKISSSNRIQKITPISEFPKQKITEKPRTMESQLKTEELPVIGLLSIKKEEKSKGPSSTQLHTIPPISDLPQQKTTEKPVSIDSQLQTKEVELVLSISNKKEEKPKLTYYSCKFCGLKLPKKANFCLQCGTIIKNK